jgi:hypothetical protein
MHSKVILILSIASARGLAQPQNIFARTLKNVVRRAGYDMIVMLMVWLMVDERLMVNEV